MRSDPMQPAANRRKRVPNFVHLGWWGYEISLPPSVLVILSSYHSKSATLFREFRIFVAMGGAPQLAPFLSVRASPPPPHTLIPFP